MATTTDDFKGLTYFITGVNRGIGRGLVESLLQKSHNVRIIATIRTVEDEPEVQITKDPRLTILKLDLNDKDSFVSLAAELKKIDWGIDIFISNAASNNAKSNILNSTSEEYIQFFKVNTVGPIETVKILKPYLLKRQTRKIIFTSSVMGSIEDFPNFLFQAYPSAPYGTSKASLNFIGKGLSYELKHDKFIVVNYHPGLVNTRNKTNKPNDDITVSKDFKPGAEFLEYISKHRLTLEEGVEKELEVIDKLTIKDSGKFLTYDGSELKY